MMENIEDTADFALEESDVRVLVCDTPIAAMLRARNTCIQMPKFASMVKHMSTINAS
jgi:hypothetical protein